MLEERKELNSQNDSFAVDAILRLLLNYTYYNQSAIC